MSGHNIFVSYKYDDRSVGPSKHLPKAHSSLDYLRYLKTVIENSGSYHYRGEQPNDDLSDLSEDEIQKSLNNRMFYTSITIVLMSPCMIDPGKLEKDQWIPREIRYSLREKERTVGESHMNGMIAVVLPDQNGSYDYLIAYNPWYNNYHVRRDCMFSILKNNMCNRRYPEPSPYCRYPSQTSNDSYIPVQTWNYFIEHFSQSMDLVLDIRSDWMNYDIVKIFDCDKSYSYY